MGIDTERFVKFDSDANNDLICPICTNVLEDPILTECEHMFCTQCINLWMGSSNSCRCPVCNNTIRGEQFRPIPRIARNMLNNLVIRCENDGCDATTKLEYYNDHINRCIYGGDRRYFCEPTAPPEGSFVDIRTECAETSEVQTPGRRTDRFSCLSCVQFCLRITEEFVTCIFYFCLFLAFLSAGALGYFYQDECPGFPRLPIAWIILGVSSDIALVAHVTKTYVERFKENRCRIITLFKYIAIMAAIYIIIITYGWWMQSDGLIVNPSRTRFECNANLIEFSFWSVAAALMTLMFIWSYAIIKSFCIFLFE